MFPSQLISIKFSRFDVEPGIGSCNNDNVTLYDVDKLGNRSVTGVYCNCNYVFFKNLDLCF